MKAIVQDTYGSADVLELREIERPAVGEHDVLFAVEAAGVDRSVWHTMTGRPTMARLFLGLRAPKVRVRGGEAAGTVVEVGAAVTRFAVGDAVFGTAPGTYAEFAVAAQDRLAHRPANMSAAQAASLPISGAAAWFAVEAARIQPGHRILVLGASGGVGVFAVQLAKAAGAHVTGVASTDKLDLVRSIGADEVLDYTAGDVVDGSVRYDAIIDIGGNRPIGRLRKALTRSGTLAIVGGEDGRGAFLGGFQRQMSAGLVAAFVSQRLTGVMSNEGAVPLEAVRAAAEAGVLVPSIEREFSLAEAPDAIRALEARAVRGKVVVRVAHAGSEPSSNAQTTRRKITNR
jgi:NADPH:quinone reductase-like Zn-dependent oxidoreductase